jgi:VWFA-related protein
MRLALVIAFGIFLLAVVPGAAHDSVPNPYRIQINEKVSSAFEEHDGRRALYVTVRFKVIRDENAPAGDVSDDEVVVREDGAVVATQKLFQTKIQDLTTVLAMDVSGSMVGRSGQEGLTKMDQAKQAARIFLDRLADKVDTGLVLFDHEIKTREQPARDRSKIAAHRQLVKELIASAQPAGGTAYLDAASVAVRMLKGIPGRRMVVIMTDGVDVNSKRTLKEAIREANDNGVPIYTVGIGEPGKPMDVTTVLVLDHSGSMRGKADATDKVSKIDALKRAATRFVDLIGHDARTTLLPFSTNVEAPGSFVTKAGKNVLLDRIQQLKPDGGTLLYDATYAGIETLVAAQSKGRKAVVVLTDGKDEAPGSRVSDQLVIERAKEEGIPLYMLGLGRPEEINEGVMKRMAAETGGKYFHAGDEQRLFEIFEKLSIDLHDNGIDETSLRQLAEKTGGKYVPARDISKLPEFLADLATELQATYEIKFPSRRSSHDGTARGIDLSVERGGVAVSNVGSEDYNVRGVVVPEMDYRIYLVLLVLVSCFLLAPVGVRRLHRLYGGQ